jgi:membrane protein implicated in regulation of membrane protease activity
MAESTIWWLLTGTAVVLELLTGTFYLLMLAIGLAAGALSAHLGLGLTAQLVLAAVIGSVTTALLYFLRRRRPTDPSVRSLRSVNLDVGEIVTVDAWQSDGTASVRYRGAQWQVITRSGQPEGSGSYRVAELVGNKLLVEKV